MNRLEARIRNRQRAEVIHDWLKALLDNGGDLVTAMRSLKCVDLRRLRVFHGIFPGSKANLLSELTRIYSRKK